MSERRTAEQPTRGLMTALWRRKPTADCCMTRVGHSIRSDDYQRLRADHRITCSMSRKQGSCLDGVVVEHLFYIPNAQLMHHPCNLTQGEARESSFEWGEARVA